MDGKEKTLEKSRKGWTRRLPILASAAALILYLAFESGAVLIEGIARMAAGITLDMPTGTPYDFVTESIGIVWPFLIVLIFGNLFVYRKKGFLTLPMSKVRGFLLPADISSAGQFISDRPQCKVRVCHYPS